MNYNHYFHEIIHTVIKVVLTAPLLPTFFAGSVLKNPRGKAFHLTARCSWMCKIINVNLKNSRGPRIGPCGTPCNRRKMGGIIIINYMYILRSIRKINFKPRWQTNLSVVLVCCCFCVPCINRTPDFEFFSIAKRCGLYTVNYGNWIIPQGSSVVFSLKDSRL